MQGWHRVTVARYQDGLQEQARRLVDGEWIPRESRTENVRGAQRGKKIIENSSDRGGDQERRHRGNRRFTSVKQVSGSYHGQEHWQSDVNEHSSFFFQAEDGIRLRHEEGDLHAQASVERI